MRRAAKVDLNHRELVQTFRALGAEVQDLSRVGCGCPDLLVSHGGRSFLVEVKGARGKLTPDQRDWHNRWQAPVYIVRTVEEAVSLLNRKEP